MKCIDYTAECYWDSILNSSLCKFFILSALTDGPAHGYEIIHRVDRITKSFCIPTQGTIYPVLREFLDCGCLICSQEIVHGRTRKIYALTAKGYEAYEIAVDMWQRGMCCVASVIARKE